MGAYYAVWVHIMWYGCILFCMGAYYVVWVHIMWYECFMGAVYCKGAILFCVIIRIHKYIIQCIVNY